MSNRQFPECIPALLRAGIALDDALALRKIAMTLHRWHELECGDGNNYGSWCIVRGKLERPYNPIKRDKETTFYYDETATPYIEHHHYTHGRGKDYVTYTRIADREAGAKRRLALIMAKYPHKVAYIQTDPRGASLYILNKSDIPTDATIDSCYSRGVAVYK